MLLEEERDSLFDYVRIRAQRAPTGTAFVFLSEDGSSLNVTNERLHLDAVAFAHALHAMGIERGDLVVLVLQHTYETVAAFLGAIYLGAIPSVFPYLTPKMDHEIYKSRVQQLVKQIEASAIITFPAIREDFVSLLADGECRVMSIDDVPSDTVTEHVKPYTKTHTSEDAAFLQFSSGTTGFPKGVLLSHRGVLNNIRALAKHHRYTADDITVSWGPLYHDMGLVVGVLMPIVSGASAVLIPPSYWVRSPKSLLWAIHNYGATVTWIPNFALNHTVRSVRDRDLDGLDLSSCRIFGAAAEPVRLDSLEMFAERFEKYGFRREALMAGYGLAENVVGVSCTSLERAPEVDWVSVQDLQQADRAVPVLPYSEGARPIVSCGHPLNGTEIRVVDESGDNLPDRYAGEVVIRSNSLFTGYFRRPDLTTGAIRNGWLHTGDIGYLVDGQLYICGRKKDLIIVGGMNIYPADVEEIANRNPNLRPGRAVAIGLPNDRLGTEDLVLICELRPEVAAETYDDIARELRFRVVQELNVALADVRFVDRGWVLKTTSGKLARTRNQQKYLGAFRQ